MNKMNSRQYFQKEYGHELIESVIDMKDFVSLYALMDEFAKWCAEQKPPVITTLPIDRFDAEKWLQEKKDIWNHPIVSDRTNKNGYEVADLMAEFVNDLLVDTCADGCYCCGTSKVIGDDGFCNVCGSKSHE